MENHYEIKQIGSCKYMGRSYPLQVQIDTSVKKTQVDFDGKIFSCIGSDMDETTIISALESFYKKQCKKTIQERLQIYQPKIRVKYRSVSINERMKQWGSCSSDRHLTFQWRLVLFPIEAIDYVVVHELCHLKHMNHDRSFWRLVGKVYPDYKSAMKLLHGDS